MKCPHCNQEHPDGTKFCPETGQKMPSNLLCCPNEECINHGKYVLPSDSNFCPDCGAKLNKSLNSTNKKNIEEENIDRGSVNPLSTILQSIINNMVQVKGDCFKMGCDDGKDDEYPSHMVELKTFRICKYPVTQKEWEAIMGWNQSTTKGDELPVDHVSWNDCEDFINKLNELTGLSFRLPTEAEWEFAARGGRKSQNYRYSGSNNPNDVAWFDGSTHKVGLLKPNELGLYDMSGNVSEWCSDFYDEEFYRNSSKFNPRNDTDDDCDYNHVIRGGNCLSDKCGCRVFARDHAEIWEDGYYGLRLVHGKTMKIDSEKVEKNMSKECHSLSPNIIIDNINMDMIYVEGGTFMMGATAEQGEDPWDNEKPTHKVTVSSYHICKHPVTIREWEAVMGKSKYITGEPYHPVHQITWDDCHQFIEKLNSLTGKNYRLPKEAEWEFAARGGNNSMGYKYSGSNNIDDVANYSQNGGCWYDNTCNVMHKLPNELGIFDMSGNVWEWCEDWYGDYSNGCQINPTGPSKGEYRVIRGGGADSSPGRCRVSSRDLKLENAYGIGFRLVY